MHLAAISRFQDAYERALAKTLQWQIGEPVTGVRGQVPQVRLPWNNAVLSLPYLADDVPDPAFAMELFLQEELNRQSLANPTEPDYVNIQRLLELYELVLVTDSVDLEADERAWARVLAANPRDFFALTADGKFKALLPRGSLMSALVTRIVLSQDGLDVTGLPDSRSVRRNGGPVRYD
jgi:hypothetical protein